MRFNLDFGMFCDNGTSILIRVPLKTENCILHEFGSTPHYENGPNWADNDIIAQMFGLHTIANKIK